MLLSAPAVVALAALCCAGPAGAASTVIARPGAATAIRSYAGWSAWQRFDRAGQRYVLEVRSPGGTITERPETAPIGDELNPEPEAIPFDLGPDAAGHPSLLVGTCVGQRCALGIARLPSGPVRRIAGTATAAGKPPVSMTLWRTRVAWADGGGSVRLRTVPGAAARTLNPWPAQLCIAASEGGGCVPRRESDISELELRGNLLASVVHFTTKTQAGFDTARLGLFNTTTGHRHVEDEVIAGLGGQTFLAPAFPDAHTVSWLLTCTGDPGGCTPRFGIYRRDLRTNRVRFAREETQRDGWAPIGDAAALLGPGGDACIDQGGTMLGDCAIRLRTLNFRTVPGSRHEPTAARAEETTLRLSTPARLTRPAAWSVTAGSSGSSRI